MGTDSINVDSLQAQKQTSWANARVKLHSHVHFGLMLHQKKIWLEIVNPQPKHNKTSS